MFIKIVESEYITSDEDVKDYFETFKEVYVFGVLVYTKIINSTNKERTQKFFSRPKQTIGFK